MAIFSRKVEPSSSKIVSEDANSEFQYLKLILEDFFLLKLKLFFFYLQWNGFYLICFLEGFDFNWVWVTFLNRFEFGLSEVGLFFQGTKNIKK